ncbi:MAG: putative Ig domain-containing protein, partial [Acidobacteria bacterium]|nr:putative Ig domain-containing protein [Acidobacteriota bacterium]
GGTPPYVWTVSAGALPPGLSMNAGTGQISGVPSQAGAFSFTARVTDWPA